MQALDYLINDYKPFKEKSTVKDVKTFFRKTSYSHFPVVKNGVYQGSIAKNDIDFMHGDDRCIEEVRAKTLPFLVFAKANWFEVLQLFADNDSNILPVVDEELNYLGYYELNDYLNIFKQTPFLHNEGVILIVSKNVKEYSFSEITQIVEANNATLFGAFVSKIEDDRAEIILKLSLHDINNSVQSFRRYGYKIMNKLEKDHYLETLNDRSNYLQKFLNI